LSQILSSLIVAGAVVWAAVFIGRALRPPRAAQGQADVVRLLALFAPALAAMKDDPRALLVWQPLAITARKLYPAAFAALDEASGATFPFTTDQIQSAHARWTTDWLCWERTHDAEYKLKAAAVEHEMADAAGSVYGRARLAAVEGEKLDRYQRRYEEYTTVSRALQALLPAASR
jgi:hypothetical protein